MMRGVAPALALVPPALLAGAALLVNGFHADLPGVNVRRVGVAAAPVLWVSLGAAVAVVAALLHLAVRCHRGAMVRPGDLGVVIALAAFGLCLTATAMLGGATGDVVAEGVPDAPRVALVADRPIYLSAGLMALIAAMASWWLHHIVALRDDQDRSDSPESRMR